VRLCIRPGGKINVRREGIHLDDDGDSRPWIGSHPIDGRRTKWPDFLVLIEETAAEEWPGRATSRKRSNSPRSATSCIHARAVAVDYREPGGHNEELETAKEELQSSNEELTTLNEELQNRNAELGQLADDLSNLLVGSISLS